MLNILYPKVTEIRGLFISHGNDIAAQDEKNRKRGDSPRKKKLKAKAEPLGAQFTVEDVRKHFGYSMDEANQFLEEILYHRIVEQSNPTRKVGKYKVYVRTWVGK